MWEQDVREKNKGAHHDGGLGQCCRDEDPVGVPGGSRQGTRGEASNRASQEGNPEEPLRLGIPTWCRCYLNGGTENVALNSR